MSIKNKAEAAVVSAAGCLFVYGGKVLLIYRGSDVVDPDCWCGAGGKIEPGETPEEAALRECDEEVGFRPLTDEHYKIIPLYRYESDKLVFHNFLVILDKPFVPILNWESAGYCWFEWGKWPHPDNLHYGFKAILEDFEAEPILRNAMDASLIPSWKDYK